MPLINQKGVFKANAGGRREREGVAITRQIHSILVKGKGLNLCAQIQDFE